MLFATVVSTLKILFLVDSNSPSYWTILKSFWCVIRVIIIFRATLRSGPNSSENTHVYIYLPRNTHKWVMTHRVLKYNRSKISVSYHKPTVVITGRAHLLHDYIESLKKVKMHYLERLLPFFLDWWKYLTDFFYFYFYFLQFKILTIQIRIHEKYTEMKNRNGRKVRLVSYIIKVDSRPLLGADIAPNLVPWVLKTIIPL